MDAAKIRLSPKEMDLVCNAGFILTKNEIIRKVYELFGQLAAEQVKLLPREKIKSNPPKISRGENYKGLPWVMLDYPRLFEKEDALAIRFFFWWGNFFSITLQLSGRYKKLFENNVASAWKSLQEQGYYCCVNDDPWEHDFSEYNYAPIPGEQVFVKTIREKNFIKLSCKTELTAWDDAAAILLRQFRMLQKICEDR